MKQKKSPVMIVVALGVIVVFAMLMNATDGFTKLPRLNAAAEREKAMEQLQKASEGSKDSNMAALRASRERNKGRTPEEAATGRFTLPTRPAIFLDEFKRFDPIENETQTSAQWYRDGSRMEEKTEDQRAARGMN